MKFVVVTIKTGIDEDKRPMIYPDLYDAVDVGKASQGPLVYDGGIQRGGLTAEMLMYVNDRLANAYTVDPLMRELTQVEADAWLAANPKVQDAPVEQITDADRMQGLLAKNAAGQALSQEDLDAVNPDNSTIGITKRTRDTAGYYGV